MHLNSLLLACIFILIPSVAFDLSEFGVSGQQPRCLDPGEAIAVPNVTRGTRLDPVLLVMRDWLSHCLATQTARIILEDLLNQRTVWIHNQARFPRNAYEDVACRAEGADCLEPQYQFDADIENWQVFPYSDRHRQFVDIDGTVIAIPVGFSGKEGFYFAPYDAAQNPWDSWDFYKRHWDEDVLNRFPRAGTVDVLAAFDGNNEAPGYCGKAWNAANPMSTGSDWCTNGRYVPPVCQSNFSACREMYHPNIFWAKGYIEQLITNLNLKYVVSYIQPKFAEILLEMTKTQPAVYYYYEPAPLTTVFKGRRIIFPLYSHGCWDGVNTSPDGALSCDFPEKVLYNVMAGQLKKSNSLALSTLQQFKLSQADINLMIADHKDADVSGFGKDCFNVSCAFVKANMQKIKTWLPKCASNEVWIAEELRCIRQCAPGRVGQDCRRCPPGSVPNQAQTDCNPCLQGYFADQASEVPQCRFCEPGTYQNEIGQTHCKQCPLGTATKYPGSTSCTVCGTEGGVVFYGPHIGLSDCVPCPTGAACPDDEDGVRVRHLSLPGWYLATSTENAGSSVDNGGEQFYNCPNSDPHLGNACLGANACIQVDGRITMEGLFCGTCRPGFQQDIEGGVCIPCSGEKAVLVMYIILDFFIVAITVGTQVFFHVTMDFGQPMEVYVVILKQFFNYAQLLSVVLAMNKFRVFDFGAMMSWAQSIASPPTVTTFSLDCLYMFGNDMPAQYDRVLRAFIEPFLFLALTNSGYLMIAKIREVRWRAPIDWSQCVPVSIICLFVIHPRLNEAFCRTFRCIVADEARLISNLSVRCDSVDHGLWQLVAASGVALYSLGIPLMFFIALFRSRKHLQQARYRRLFGFLYNGFEPQFYYFEVVFMLRKVLFQVVAVLPGMYNNTQAEGQSLAHLIGLSFLSGGFLCFHLMSCPFDDRANGILDKVETAMLVAITGTVLLNLLARGTDSTSRFQDESARRVRDTILFAVMFALHLYFYACVVFGVFRGQLHRLLDRLQGTPFAAILRAAGWQREGHMVYKGDRLDMSDLSDTDRDALSSTIGGLIRHRIGHQNELHSADLFESISYCCTEGRLMRDKIASKPSASKSQPAEDIECNGSFSATAKSFLDTVYDLMFGFVEVPAPQEYTCPTNVKDTEGEKFTVEELQVSLMRMHADRHLEDCLRERKSQLALAPGMEKTQSIRSMSKSTSGTTNSANKEAPPLVPKLNMEKARSMRSASKATSSTFATASSFEADSCGLLDPIAEVGKPCGSRADNPSEDVLCDADYAMLLAATDGPVMGKVWPTNVQKIGATEYGKPVPNATK